MKVIIDLIEDVRTAINNDGTFSLMAMGLKEAENTEYIPAWESRLCSMKLDDEKKALYLFLGKDKALGIGELLQDLNVLANEKMMYEVRVSYSKDAQRIDSPLLGFGESLENKQYIFFVSGE
jgi:hypothetical protein